MKGRKHRKEELADLRGIKDEELKVRERDLTEQLFWMRFKLRNGQAENTANIGKAKKSVARIKTILRELSLKGAGS